MTKTGRIVFFLFIAIVGTYFLMIGISAAENFLAPVVVAILLSMLVLPLADKLEHWGVARGWSSFWSDLLLLIVTIFFFFIISAQIKLVADDWDEIRSKFEPRLEKVLDYIHTKTGVSLSKQFNLDEYLGTGEKQGNSNTKQAKQNNSEKENNQSAIDKKEIVSGVAGTAAGIATFLWKMFLVFIYVFFFLLYRQKVKKSLLKLIPHGQRKRTSDIINNSIDVAKSYLAGKFLLILFLAVFYSGGMLLIGVKYAIFAGIVAAILTLIPYFGNIIGGGIALLLASVSGGSLWVILGVAGVFLIGQMIENYVLEPYIVGRQVELNPIVIIVVVVLGEAVWGVMGMVLAVPVTAIVKVIFDNIPMTEALGYTLGNEDIGGGNGIFKKLQDKIGELFGGKNSSD